MILGANKKTIDKRIYMLALIIVSLFVGICFTIFSFSDHGLDKSKAAFVNETGKNSISILAAGKDTVSGLMDVLLLINVDLEHGSINIIQIPRDTFLNVPSGSQFKINSASRSLGGMDQFVTVLENALHLNIDHTVEFTQEAFSRFIDLIGGVEVNVPCDMDYDDPQQDLFIHLKAGKQLLYGIEAVQFVRYRSGYIQGDIARIDAQKIFIAALADNIKNGLSPYKIPAIAGALIGDVKTDMSLRRCISLADFALNISMSNIRLTTLPGEAARTKVNSGAWYYVICKRAAFDVIDKYFYFGSVDYESFDQGRIFCSSEIDHFKKIYHSERYNAAEYTADDILNNGIDIDLATKKD